MHMNKVAVVCGVLASLWALPGLAQDYRNPNPTPSTVPATPVAPNAGASGDAAAGSTAAPSHGPVVGSDNGGQLAGSDVPGGRNHAPTEGQPAQSFSGPIKKD